MYQSVLETRYVGSVIDGVSPVDLPYIASFIHDYKHGVIEDVVITLHQADPKYNNGNTFQQRRVISTELAEWYKSWGVKIPTDAMLIMYSTNHHVTMKKDTSVPVIYECNSRAILKQLRETSQLIEASRKLSKSKEVPYRYGEKISFARLMTIILTENNEQKLNLCKEYRTSVITETLASPKFRHFYKMAHPDTKFIIGEKNE